MKQKGFPPVFVWIIDQEGVTSSVSADWLESTGKTLEQTLKAGWLDDIHPEDREPLQSLTARRSTTREEHPVHFRLKQGEETFAPVGGLVVPFFLPGGDFGGWIGTATPTADGTADAVFSLITNNLREIICLISPDGRVEYISPAVNNILGYSPDELIGEKLAATFLPPKNHPILNENLTINTEGNPTRRYETRVCAKSGELVWLEVDLRMVKDNGGRLVNIHLAARDITQLKHSEEIARLQEEIASALWETTDLKSSLKEVIRITLSIEDIDSGGIYLADQDTGHLHLVTQIGLSEAFADAVSYFPSDHPLIALARSGQPLYTNYPEFGPQIEEQPPSGAAEEKILGFASLPLIYKKKLIAVFNLSSHTTTEIPKHCRQMLEVLSRQIGELVARNIAEADLRESEEKFRSFFEQATDTMTLADENGRIVEWNPASEELTGIPASEAIGRSSLDIQFDLLPPAKKSAAVFRKMEDRYNRIRSGGSSTFLNRILEGQILDKNGRLRTFQQLIFPILTSEGVMLGSTGRDVTHLKLIEKAELEQRKLTEALIDSAAVLNSSLKMETIFESIFRLVAGIVTIDGGSLLLIDPMSGRVKVAWAVGSQERLFTSRGVPQEFDLTEMQALVHMFESTKPLMIEDIYESRLFQDHHGNTKMHSFLGVPIRSNQKVIGFLNLLSAETDHFQEKHAEWLMAFANQAALAIENARLFAKVEQLAVQDELTRVYNRRGLKEIGGREVERAHRFNHPLAALFLDVDHFKEINDKHSHAAGDQVLRAVAACALKQLRSVDVIGRYGGEEFAVLLPETDLENARLSADRLRMEIGKLKVNTLHGGLNVTVSIGVSCLTEGVTTLDGLLDKADAAVHRAKAAGRNRVEVG